MQLEGFRAPSGSSHRCTQHHQHPVKPGVQVLELLQHRSKSAPSAVMCQLEPQITHQSTLAVGQHKACSADTRGWVPTTHFVQM